MFEHLFAEERRTLSIITIIVLVALIVVASFYAGIQHERSRVEKEFQRHQERMERQGRTPYSQIEEGQPKRAPLYFFMFKKTAPRMRGWTN